MLQNFEQRTVDDALSTLRGYREGVSSAKRVLCGRNVTAQRAQRIAKVLIENGITIAELQHAANVLTVNRICPQSLSRMRAELVALGLKPDSQ
ncbi:hypothetical protein [Hyphomicrobium sp. CS1GBMeth3]|uniref:hypothetical protein n=1 Tax=Hyphomicrobium sp. CS1GBMeth3 TaxID=1892845 RepID=UPI000931D721|nr:hypothetical protein [Hyphomicrobium sp. CS1GBMeth3]